MSETEPVPDSLAPLQPWLEAHVPMAEAVELLGVRKASSGFSADTTMVDVAVTRGGIANDERYVLRTESPDPPVYPVQVPGWQVEIELQYRILLHRGDAREGRVDARHQAYANPPNAVWVGGDGDAES